MPGRYLLDRVPHINEPRRHVALKVLWAVRKHLDNAPVEKIIYNDDLPTWFDGFRKG